MENMVSTHQPLPANTPALLRVLLVGGGSSGEFLLNLLRKEPNIAVIGVIDRDPEAPGLKLAHQWNIPTGNDYRELLLGDVPDLVINMTGNMELQQEISLAKSSNTVLIGKKSANLIWNTLDPDKKNLLLKQFLYPGGSDGEGKSPSGFIIGNTDKMREIASMIVQVAPTPTTVLIRGESGTGKELVARMIHNRSPWRDKPLITVNCTAFSAGLIESELFGHKKGAFTGAVADRTGLLELAHKGTILLDEIGEMPVEMQAKLLRFLQSGEIRAVGDHVTKKVDVRVIAATNRNLETAIRNREFRSDLFYRLNAFTIYLPSLRERLEDIPPLAYHFLQIANQKVKKQVNKITPPVLSAIMEYEWPGNIRELKNVIERAVVMATGHQIEMIHLPVKLRQDSAALEIQDTELSEGLMALKSRMVNRFEYEAICRYLTASQGNVSRAAAAAQVPRRTFQRLMAKHRISTETFKTNGSAG